jgi:thiamine-phosphate pyrophosphorylase
MPRLPARSKAFWVESPKLPKPDFDLYLITDRTQTRGRDLLWVLEQALDAGVKAIQLREKDLGGRDLFSLAEKLSKLCQSYRSALFINERIDIALAVDAAGVQLGNGSVPVPIARKLLGAHKMIGSSSHCLEEAMEAQEGGADFVLFGPVYLTPSKAVYGAPQGLNRLKEIVEKISLPVYAIGGVKLDYIPDLRRVGVFGIALISAIISSDSPKAATNELLRVMASG